MKEKYTLLELKEKLNYIINKYCIEEDENYDIKTIHYTLDEGWLIDKLREVVDYYEENVLSEEDKDEITKYLINDLMSNREERRRLIEEIARQHVLQKNAEEEVLYGKEDIMRIFNCESDKALKILKYAFQTRHAIKMGKEYYITKDSYLDFLDLIQGREVRL